MRRTKTMWVVGLVGVGLIAAVRTAAADEAAGDGEAAPVAQARRPARPAVDPSVLETYHSPVLRERPKSKVVGDEPRFFAGLRAGIGAPPSARGLTPTGGLELGVAAREGVGLGLHLLGILNPPAIAPLGIPKAEFGFGAAADLRFYIQTVDPLTLYPTLSVGFLAGPTNGGENAVLPVINPGFGARVKLAQAYVSFEFGLAGFFIPFINMSVGWEGSPQA